MTTEMVLNFLVLYAVTANLPQSQAFPPDCYSKETILIGKSMGNGLICSNCFNSGAYYNSLENGVFVNRSEFYCPSGADSGYNLVEVEYLAFFMACKFLCGKDKRSCLKNILQMLW